VLLRNNLRWTQTASVQVDWSTPIALGNAVRVHAQVTSPGESLIDYNHRQNTFGLDFLSANGSFRWGFYPQGCCSGAQQTFDDRACQHEAE
jgi:hypothetical protein